MEIFLDEAIPARGGKIQLDISWSFIVPRYCSDHIGQYHWNAGTIYEIAQWYPSVCTTTFTGLIHFHILVKENFIWSTAASMSTSPFPDNCSGKEVTRGILQVDLVGRMILKQLLTTEISPIPIDQESSLPLFRLLARRLVDEDGGSSSSGESCHPANRLF